MADASGHYTIKVSGSNATLVFSFVGYGAIEEKVGNSTTIDVTLKETLKELNEVVVVGYGTVKRKDLTGSVASVSGKDLAATPVPNVAQALQGKLPGVSVTSQDGRPGANVSIRVRGGGSISSSNDPLILIDGQPGNLGDIPSDQVESIDVLKDASSTAIYGSRGANGVVLLTTKAAKAGKTQVSYNGYMKFNTPTKYLDELGPYDYLKYVWANTAAYGAAYQTPFEKLFGLGANAGANAGGIESYRDLPLDDVQRQLYNSSKSMNHALTVTGGTDKTKVLFSTNYTDEQGMKVNSYYKRYNATFKIDQKLADNLSFGLNTRYTETPSVDAEGTSSNVGSILSSAYRFRPIATNHILGDITQLTAANNIEQFAKNSMLDNYGPVIRTLDADPYSNSKSVNTLASLTWGIVKGLTFHTDLNLTRGWNDGRSWSGAYASGYIDDATGNKLYAGNASLNKSDNWSTRWSNTLNYEFTINKIHKFSVLGGNEIQNSGGTSLSISANHFPANFTEANSFALINQFDATAGSVTYSSGVSTPYRLNSFFGRLNYSLLDRYLLTFNFRADGSSRFSPLNHWGYFPAGAFAWRISEEPLIKKLDLKWLDSWKFRVGYGQVGNDNITPGLFAQTWGSVTNQTLQADIAQKAQAAYDLSNSGSLANPNLKWETTVTRGIGTDFTLFNGRLSGTIDLYSNYVTGLLMKTTIPPISGFTTTTLNFGQTSNKGVELSLSGEIYKNHDWRVSASGNINFNKNNIDYLNSNTNTLYGTGWASSQQYPASDYVLLPGHPVGLVRGLVYDGIYTTADFNYSGGVYTLKPGVADLGSFIQVLHGITNADKPATQFAYPGLPKFKDLNGDGKIDDKDIDIIGNMNAKHTGGFALNVGYKNIDLGLNFNWSFGNQIYNLNKLAGLYGAKEGGVYENKLAMMKNSYKIYDVVNGQIVRLTTPDQLDAANVNANLPLTNNEAGITSSFGIEDGSFLRLNTLTVGYTIPKSIMSKVKISNLRIYGSVYNVFTVTGYSGLDPEVSTNGAGSSYPTPGEDYGTYPRPRSFILGLNINF